MTNDMISVIIPVYNVERTLHRCVDSVLSQTYKNFEIILVDDCSPDHSGSICDFYKEKYHNVKVIHKIKNEGLGFARNSGLTNAIGDYVFFLDSDDEIKNETLMKLITNIRDHDSDICLGGYLRVKQNQQMSILPNVDSNVYSGEKVKELATRMLGANCNGKDDLDHMVAKNLYSLELIKRENIQFLSEREILAEDFMFSLDILQHANKISICDYDGYIYYDNENTLTTAYRANRFNLLLNLNQSVNERITLLKLSTVDSLRFKRTFLTIVQRCMSQEVRFKKFNQALSKINEYCTNSVVKNYINDLYDHEESKRNCLMYLLIKYRFSFLIYIVFYVYNMKKRSSVNE